MSKQGRAAAFFDRDGTINVDFGHVYELEKLVFVPNISEIIREYNKENVPVIVITNQAGIAKGLYSEAQMHAFNHHLNIQLASQFDAHIDAFYFCPHHPNYTGECQCRKPKPGLFLRAAKDWNLDLSASIMYGDKESDGEAALSAGIPKFTLVKYWQDI